LTEYKYVLKHPQYINGPKTAETMQTVCIIANVMTNFQRFLDFRLSH
jgi:hypothetical protein